ncbi:MAG TPA: uL13 family ribosomal protein [Candidatus Paceibacterota bacterium]
MNKETKIVDAKGRTIGRIASEAAKILCGKTSASFERHTARTTKVKITNAKLMHIPLKKQTGKGYVRYTGYPGGLRKQRLEEIITKKGVAEPLRLAIYGMVPANKLRAVVMRNLVIEE